VLRDERSIWDWFALAFASAVSLLVVVLALSGR
jgi:hypothetical protein